MPGSHNQSSTKIFLKSDVIQTTFKKNLLNSVNDHLLNPAISSISSWFNRGIFRGIKYSWHPLISDIYQLKNGIELIKQGIRVSEVMKRANDIEALQVLKSDLKDQLNNIKIFVSYQN
jgi:hypothetical protein